MADVDVFTAVTGLTNERDALWGPYWTSPSVCYVVLMPGNTVDIYKTIDSGASWTVQDAANNPIGPSRVLAVWYDRETPDNTGTLLHVSYTNTTANQFRYNSFDTATDTWGTDRLVDAITCSTISSKSDSGITVAKSGRIYLCGSGDLDLHVEGTDHSMRYSEDGGVSWTDAASPYSSDEELVRLYPGADADQDDIAAVVFDTINADLEFWKYDATADSWAKTAIDTAILVTGAEGRVHKRFFDAAIRHSDEHILVVYWNDLDVTTGDLRSVDVTQATPTITQRTDLHQSDDSFYATILVNQQNDDVYVAYIGKDDGSQVLFASTTAHFKLSVNDMGSWGGEQTYSIESDDLRCISLGRTIGNDGGRVMPVWFNDDLLDATVNDGNDVEIPAAADLALEFAGTLAEVQQLHHPVREVVAY